MTMTGTTALTACRAGAGATAVVGVACTAFTGAVGAAVVLLPLPLVRLVRRRRLVMVMGVDRVPSRCLATVSWEGGVCGIGRKRKRKILGPGYGGSRYRVCAGDGGVVGRTGGVVVCCHLDEKLMRTSTSISACTEEWCLEVEVEVMFQDSLKWMRCGIALLGE